MKRISYKKNNDGYYDLRKVTDGKPVLMMADDESLFELLKLASSVEECKEPKALLVGYGILVNTVDERKYLVSGEFEEVNNKRR